MRHTRAQGPNPGEHPPWPPARPCTPHVHAQAQEEQQEWQRRAAALEPFLAARGLERAQLLRAFALVRSRSFAGPHFKVMVQQGCYGSTGLLSGRSWHLPQHQLLLLTPRCPWRPRRARLWRCRCVYGRVHPWARACLCAGMAMPIALHMNGRM